MSPVWQLPPEPSRRVVEVVDRLSSTVIGVSHLEAPRRAGRRWLLVAFLLFFCCVSVVSFFKLVSIASHNDDARQADVAAGKVAHEFRPQPVSEVLEWTVIGSAVAGVFLFFVFVLGRRKTYERYLAELPAGETLSGPSYQMVSVGNHVATVRVHSAMQTRLRYANEVLTKEEFCEQRGATEALDGWMEIDLPQDCQIDLALGERNYSVRWVESGPRNELLYSFSFPTSLAGFVAASALSVVAFIYFMPPETVTIVGAQEEPETRYASTQSMPSLDSVYEPKKDVTTLKLQLKVATAAPTHDGKSSVDVRPKRTRTLKPKVSPQKKLSSSSRNLGNPRAKKPRKAEVSDDNSNVGANMGILAAGGMNQHLAALTADVQFATGAALLEQYGLDGDGMGDDAGEVSGTWGTTATKLGGVVETVKVGGYMIYSGKPGSKSKSPDSNSGSDDWDFLNKGKGKIAEVRFGTPKGTEGMDPSSINKHLRRKMGRIRSCYKSQLAASPRLRGTLTSRFTIGMDGTVITSKSEGMGNHKMESCISSAISSIRFPVSEREMRVVYPITFQST